MSNKKEITTNLTHGSNIEPWDEVVRKPAVFIGLVILLLILNWWVWVWLAPLQSLSKLTTVEQSRQAFDGDRDRLQQVLDSSCESQVVDVYSRERHSATANPSGAVSKSPSTDTQPEANTKILPYPSLLALLQNASVRVITNQSSGSGFFINNQTIVTNRHVVEENLNKPIFVTSKALGMQPVPVTVFALSPDSGIGEADFALLRLDTPVTAVSALTLSTTVSPLDAVVSVGFPGLITNLDIDRITPSPVFGTGHVATVQTQPTGTALIFHSAEISSGNSGGPLVNLCGQVVGVNTFVVTDAERIEGRALSALSTNELINFLSSHPVEYQVSRGVCGGR
jgi:S1-C subfamily serine protease